MAGENFKETKIYASLLKATESFRNKADVGLQQLTIWIQRGDVVYIRPPDWWPEELSGGPRLMVLKRVYSTKLAACRWTKQAACRWHMHILAWMQSNR